MEILFKNAVGDELGIFSRWNIFELTARAFFYFLVHYKGSYNKQTKKKEIVSKLIVNIFERYSYK